MEKYKELVDYLVKAYYSLGIDSMHGVDHWERVMRFGVGLANTTGADVELVELFAVLHDCCREHDGHDLEHGGKSAIVAEYLNGKFYNLSNNRLAILKYACSNHSYPSTSKDVIIGTCWDADRLDLTRVGLRIDTNLLSTTAAKRMVFR